MTDAWPFALWVANAVTSLAIAVCAFRFLFERARQRPLWLRLSLYAAVVGGAANIIIWPWSVELSQIGVNAGFAGTMIYRLARDRSTAA
ncbi:hypothetical protein FHP25_35830 [Vineibacter terrae]|uniref:Holin n=1 Tax=Vineibacter terrae TaxID=2586908 RepID=A0A5C8P9R9_9HYPH|nr:hypothetical protein [Vineibacter terrae]TXL70094.1 hypothetical protein FHP25_35830 [Vineibacter terrae]